jgi:acyl carrier protein
MDVIERVRGFLGSQLRINAAASLAVDYPLVARGIVDSIEMMQIVTFLEQSFGIHVEDVEIVPENIGSLGAMDAFVRRKLEAGETA